jgi:hypothetical protein
VCGHGQLNGVARKRHRRQPQRLRSRRSRP